MPTFCQILRAFFGDDAVSEHLTYAYYNKNGTKWNNNSRVIVIQFEHLLLEPKKELINICEFLGIEYNSTMLNVDRKGSSIRKDSSHIIGIDKSRSGKWKEGLSNTEIYICQKVCNHNLMKLDYIIEDSKPNWFLLGLFYLLLPCIIAYYRTKNTLMSSAYTMHFTGQKVTNKK